jgi:hypothetical protein
MNKKIITTTFTWAISTSIMLLLINPLPVHGQQCTGPCPDGQHVTNTGAACECVSNSTTNASSSTGTPSLQNPLGQNANLITVLIRIMQVVLAVVDIFALFMFILGGFQFLISAGNPSVIKRAKDTLIWATIGIVVITLSYSIMKFIFEAVQ